jgi:outer membrane immunogenic protein
MNLSTAGACAALIVVAVSAACTFTKTATAADIPAAVRKTAPPAQIFDWSGFYIGTHAGGAWSRGGASSAFDEGVFATFNQGTSLDKASLVGGLQVGRNWQPAPSWVVGIEVDFSWTDNSTAGTAPSISTVSGLPLPGGLAWSRNIDWLVSLRARGGYLVTPTTLLFVTGGVAWAEIDYSASFDVAPPVFSAATSRTKTGLAAGAGLEWMLAGGWLLRGEYLFYHFGGASAVGTNAGFPAIPVPFHWDATQLHVGRVALSRRFGG